MATATYRGAEGLPKVLGPGKYVVGGVELEVYEPVERGVVEGLLELLEGRKGHAFA